MEAPMKAILEFDLPEESSEHKLALEGGSWMSVCHDLDQWLRSIQKHGDRKSLSVDEMRARIHEEIPVAQIRVQFPPRA
ncbi:MAG TPA: hypothetical protein DCZ01_05380 [Elusimicrobia bacterium]|nr:hypothetical protein [Elusimicrobiota bacterium]